MMLPPEHPDAPKYWMHETSGVLAPAVKKYLADERIDAHEIKLIQAYLAQWVNSPVWVGPSARLEALREQVARIVRKKDIDAAISAAVEIGIDPL